MHKGNKPLIKETQNTKPKETYSCLFHTCSRGAEQQRRRESSPGYHPECTAPHPRGCVTSAPLHLQPHTHPRDTGIVQPQAEPYHLPALDKKQLTKNSSFSNSSVPVLRALQSQSHHIHYTGMSGNRSSSWKKQQHHPGAVHQ